MSRYDDETGYSGEPLPRRRSYQYDEPDDEPLPPRRRRRDRDRNRDDEDSDHPSGVVSSLGTVGVVFGVLHVAGGLLLCGMGTLFAGGFVGMGRLIAADPNVQQGRQKAEAQAAIDMCNGLGMVSGWTMVAPALVYTLAAIGLMVGGFGVIRRRHWGRVLLLISAPLAFLLDTGSVALNPVSGIIAAALALAYGIFAYVVLLLPRNVEEFSG
jgi:hypothetical protein